ncbi:MAG: hypothetical protein MPN21_01775 [Thermoanaerobaculia bacterium]|nr:hypothetical protein [Thermoanaerobaculia bacterium]
MNKDELSSSIEVSGRVVLALVHVMGAFRHLALDILRESGIENPEEDRWYPLRSFLDAFDTIVERIGPNTLSAIGRQIVAQAPFPAEIDHPKAALSGLDEAYRAEHRGGEVGHYHFEVKGPRQGLMTSTTPYPDSFDRGLIRALVEKFEPQGVIDVRLQKSTEPANARSHGHTYSVSW